MKKIRQRQVLQLVTAEAIRSQEQLRSHLARKGCKVTQATLSRDLKDLKIVKVSDSTGSYRYQALEGTRPETPRSTASGNLIVIRTKQGVAAALAYEIDALDLDEISGTVAGEDTVLAVVAEGQQAVKVEHKLWNILKT